MLKRKSSICVILFMALVVLGRVQPAFADGCGPAASAGACAMGDDAPRAVCCATAMQVGGAAPVAADGEHHAAADHAKGASAPTGHACSMQICLQSFASLLSQTQPVFAPSPSAERLTAAAESILPSRLTDNLFRPPRTAAFQG